MSLGLFVWQKCLNRWLHLEDLFDTATRPSRDTCLHVRVLKTVTSEWHSLFELVGLYDSLNNPECLNSWFQLFQFYSFILTVVFLTDFSCLSLYFFYVLHSYLCYLGDELECIQPSLYRNVARQLNISVAMENMVSDAFIGVATEIFSTGMRLLWTWRCWW